MLLNCTLITFFGMANVILQFLKDLKLPNIEEIHANVNFVNTKIKTSLKQSILDMDDLELNNA